MQSRKVKLNIVLSVLLTLSLLFASVPVRQVNAAGVVRDQESAILLAADHLVELQNSDGGFGWNLPLPDEPVSYTNVLGITSLGILKANEFQNKDIYETALAGAYDYAVNNSPVYTWSGGKFIETNKGVDSSPDITFLVWLAQAAAGDATLLAAVNNLQDPDFTVEDIAALAKTRWDSKILYFGSTSETDPDGTAASMAQRLLADRLNVGPAIGIWDVELAVKAALALDFYFPAQGYAQQADDMTEVLFASVDTGSYFSSTDTSQADYVLGLTAAIEAFAETGLHLDKAAELKTILIDLQQADGSWNYYGAAPASQSVQSTAYALMALNSLGGVEEMTTARKGADWLVKNQNSDGGWYSQGGVGVEYLEEDSEASWALAVVPATVTIGDLGYYSIQSAIDSASAGDTINVFPGAYDETANGRYLFNATGPYQFGLFLGEGKNGITLQGVDELGTPVTDYNNVQASVTTNATNSFGTSGVFVETDNITVTGLEFLNNTAGDNKTIEVIGDNFTLKHSVFSIPEQGGSVYLNDWRYDDVTPASYVESYTIDGNYFKYNTSVDISSGAGFTGDPANRKIINNVFDAQYSTSEVGERATVSFNGYCPSVGWFVDPVGGAVITGNSFSNGVQYIRTRCIPDTTGFDWESYWNDNTYDKKVIAGSNPPGTVTSYSYGDFTDVRRIGTSIQFAIDNAAAGDTINVANGVYVENIRINKSLTLAGAGSAGTILMPAVSLPNPCSNSTLCGSPTAASNVILVEASDVVIHDLTIDGDNPALTSEIVRNDANLDARNGIIKNTDAIYNNLEVYNTSVKNIYLRGIYSTGGSFNFHHNFVSNVMGDYASIAMFAWGGPGIFESNTVSYANDAISANHSKGIQFLNNSVTNSISGIHTDNSNDGGGVADQIVGNTIDCNGLADSYAIFTFVPYVAPVVDGNTITNCSVGLSAWGEDFTPSGPIITIFSNNLVTGDGSVGSVGVYITTDTFGWGYADVSVLFTGNTISGFETGLQFTADQPSWNLEPFVAKTINATFTENQIFDNTTVVSVGTTGTYNIDLSPNWWGAIAGPGETSIPAGIPYMPWCGDAACTWFMPPTANDQSVNVDYGKPTGITLSASDVGGNTLEWIVVDQPAHGTVTGTGPTLTYTPDPGFSGSDSFTFKASLETVDSNTATVSITVAEQTEWILYFPLIFNN